MSHFTHINDSCLVSKLLVFQRWMSHGTVGHASCVSRPNAFFFPLYIWMCHSLFFQIWMSHIALLDTRHVTYEWFMSHTWIWDASCVSRPNAYINESWHTHEWVMAHTWMSHVTHMHLGRILCLASKCLFFYEWIMYGTHMNESWLTHARLETRDKRHDERASARMTHSHVCHDSFISVPWLIHICVMTHSRDTRQETWWACKCTHA